MTRPPVMYLAAVVADAFDNRFCPAVSHGEAFAGHAADERLTAGGSVECDVADDDVVLGDEHHERGGAMTRPSA